MAYGTSATLSYRVLWELDTLPPFFYYKLFINMHPFHLESTSTTVQHMK